MIQALALTREDAAEFRLAAAMAHIPAELRKVAWLEQYAEARASAERRAVSMAFAALRRFVPAHADREGGATPSGIRSCPPPLPA